MSEVSFLRAWPRSADGVEVPVFLAGGGSTMSFRHQGQGYRAGLINRPRFRAALALDAGGFTGGTVPTASAMGCQPADKAVFEAMASLAWKDVRVEIDGGEETGALDRVLTGAIADMTIADGTCNFTVADMSKRFDVPVTNATFAGTGGIEGYDGATGRLKRRSFGVVRNIEGRLLDPANSIYEFGDPAKPLKAITLLRDMGRAAPAPAVVAWQGSPSATLAALIASTAVAGSGVVAPSIACAKWWTTPAAPLTADIEGEIGISYVDTVAMIASRLVTLAGGEAISNLVEANALLPGAAGLHVDSNTETYAGALDRLTLGASVIWRVAPGGAVTLSLCSFDDPIAELKGLFIGREATLPPIKSRTITYRLNHRQHGDGEVASTAKLELIGGIVTNRDPVPPESLPIDSIYIDDDNRQYRYEGGPALVGIDTLLLGEDELELPPYVDIQDKSISGGTYQVAITPPADQTVFADYLGAVLPTQFPRVLTPVVKRGGVDIRTADFVSYEIETTAISATVNSSRGSADKGRLTITGGEVGSINLTVIVDDTRYGPYRIRFAKSVAAPPSTGGTGAKTAEDTSFPTVSSTVLAAVAGPMTVTVGSGEAVTCAFAATFSITAPVYAAASLIGRWETSPAGANSWTAGPAGLIEGVEADWYPEDYSGSAGFGVFNDVITGLSAGDYDVRFVGKLSTAAGSPALTIYASTARVIVQ